MEVPLDFNINLGKIGKCMLSAGIIFYCTGILSEIKNEKYTKCLKSNFVIASSLIIASQGINIYKTILPN